MCGPQTVIYKEESKRYVCAICGKVLSAVTTSYFSEEEIKKIKGRTREQALRYELEQEVQETAQPWSSK